jgi:lipoprotein Spr
MFKKLIAVFIIWIFLASCTGLKPLAFFNSRQTAVQQNSDNNKELKFLDDISATTSAVETPKPVIIKNEVRPSGVQSVKTEIPVEHYFTTSETKVEKNSSLQFKYASLLKTEADQVQNIPLYQTIDEWYGTRYRLGGTTKKGIDCSAFVQTVFSCAFTVLLPRTARDQYKATRRISRTELKEGDLLFFKTRRGRVSHVGIYLQNNKFVHASVSGGVTISDMFEPYYVKKFIGAGRIINKEDKEIAKF